MRVTVVVPTYDERENVGPMARAILQALPQATVLFVDDNSPDGTGALLDEMSKSNPQIMCLHRPGKEGLGKAKVLSLGAEKIVQMDCDFSHDPADLPRLVASDADLAIGSRYVAGGATPGWPFKRRLISRLGGAFIRLVTGMKIADPTGGYKCWNAGLLEKMELPNVESKGYSFQLEMNYRAWKAGAKITELPIQFRDRTKGYSKISPAIARESLRIAWKLRRKCLRF